MPDAVPAGEQVVRAENTSFLLVQKTMEKTFLTIFILLHIGLCESIVPHKSSTAKDSINQSTSPNIVKLDNGEKSSPFDKFLIPTMISILTAGLTALFMHLVNKASWRLQLKTTIFTDYLNLIDDCFNKRLKDAANSTLIAQEGESIAYYSKLRIKATTVKLVLSKKDREKMDNLSNKLFAEILAFGRQTKENTRDETFETINEIYNIFHKNLNTLL